jgi:hypothetical protein
MQYRYILQVFKIGNRNRNTPTVGQYHSLSNIGVSVSTSSYVVVVYWINVDAISKMIYDGRSQFKVHTDERTQVHSARHSLAVTHPSINRGRRALTSVNEPLR